MTNLWVIINKLPKDELIDLLYEYDKYLEYAREHDLFNEGWVPVCLAEFYDAEFAMLMEERASRDQSNEEGPDHMGWSSMPVVKDDYETQDA